MRITKKIVKKKVIIGILTIAIVMGLIYQQSFQSFHGDLRMSRSMAQVVSEFLLSFSDEHIYDVDQVELILRKFAHFSEYYVLGVVTFVVIVGVTQGSKGMSILFLLWVMPTPLIDEFMIQARTVGRTPHMLDVLIDYMGISVAMGTGVLYWLIWGQSRGDIPKKS